MTSTLRLGDLVQEIGERLQFVSTEGFSLVVAIRDKTIALSNNEFLFDAIQEICSWIANDTLTKKGIAVWYIKHLMFELLFLP